jgi:hypothetical protein
MVIFTPESADPPDVTWPEIFCESSLPHPDTMVITITINNNTGAVFDAG